MMGIFRTTMSCTLLLAEILGGVNGYPSVSPYIVSAGGTTINRNPSGAFTPETAWSGSGGGPSKHETKGCRTRTMLPALVQPAVLLQTCPSTPILIRVYRSMTAPTATTRAAG